MSCEQFYPELIEAARAGIRPADAREHLDACAECAQFFETQIAMQQALRQSLAEPSRLAGLKTNDFTSEGPPKIGGDLETRLLAEFDAVHSRRRRFDWRWATAAAIAASLGVGVALIRQPAPTPKSADRPFLEIPYTPPLAPYERTRIVRMDVPVAALIAAGFEVHAPDAGAALRADVLFGQDGRAHAVRLVSDSDSNRRTN